MRALPTSYFALILALATTSAHAQEPHAEHETQSSAHDPAEAPATSATEASSAATTPATQAVAAPQGAAATSATAASAEGPVAAPEAGSAAAELVDEQPGATDSLLNGEALKIYGFGDVGYRQMLVPKSSPWLVYLNRHPSVFVGHLNFYFDSQLSERWRALAEVRFTYLPQGGWQTTDGVVHHRDTRTADYMDFTRDHPVGGLMIERAFIEYSAASWLTLQAGQFLTPYGIWNVDHGSPVIIGVTPPYMVGARLLPDSQVGLLGSGRISLVDDLELSYALGISNGRTDLIAYEDMDDNKALTARLALTYRGAGELTLGSTLYTGTNTDTTREIYFEGASPKSRENITYQVKERSLAADLRYVNGPLHFQAEGVLNDRKFTDKGRPTQGAGLSPDRRNIGGYALVGYRTPLFGIMPYVKVESSPDPALQDLGVDQNVMLFTGGLNYRPVPRVVFKGEFTYGFFPDHKPNTFADNPLAGIDLQIAWAF
ncbi:MAG TPA: hypothetical protein VHB79_26885 [Polyangiaceae bacterium]|nr:hypothetical protein [Polyangiaceae bacterium]